MASMRGHGSRNADRKLARVAHADNRLCIGQHRQCRGGNPRVNPFDHQHPHVFRRIGHVTFSFSIQGNDLYASFPHVDQGIRLYKYYTFHVLASRVCEAFHDSRLASFGDHGRRVRFTIRRRSSSAFPTRTSCSRSRSRSSRISGRRSASSPRPRGWERSCSCRRAG